MGQKVCVECSNVSEGCPRTKIPLDLLETHEKFECEYRMLICERVGCKLEGRPMNVKLLETHQKYECEGHEPGMEPSSLVEDDANVEQNEEAKVEEDASPCPICKVVIKNSCLADHMVAHDFDDQILNQ